MIAAATAWIDSLSASQRACAQMSAPGASGLSEADRRSWYYTPTDPGGLTLGAQAPPQQRLAMKLVASGLSEAGYVTVSTVMGLENVLDRVEGWSRDWGFDRGRDPGRYGLRVFGDPDAQGPWGWRFAGHHISLNYLVIDGAVVSVTPCFIGADPATSPLGGGSTLRPLGSEEDLAGELVSSLTVEQAETAVLLPRAPSDIIGGNRERINHGDEMLHMTDPRLWRGGIPGSRIGELLVEIDRRSETASGFTPHDHAIMAITSSPKGLPAKRMNGDQRSVLRRLLCSYIGRAPTVLEREAVYHHDSELDEVHFAWAGALSVAQPHYYRLQGPQILVEFDNTQRSGNHIHSVWREPQSDFGLDALANLGL